MFLQEKIEYCNLNPIHTHTMIFENPLFLIPFLSGFVFFIAGIIMMKYPPKKINSFYGYRTPKSMKSQEQWDFAQKFSSKLMVKYGIGLCLLSLLAFFLKISEGAAIGISLGFLILLAITLIIQVEKALKNNFSA